jgi:thymidylate synthase (FAD)
MGVRLIDKMGDDARIAMAAWVSTSAEDGLRRAIENPEDVHGIIRYLMRHRHGTPFEAGALQFFVHAPIFVWREWHRHRIGFAYSEYGTEGDPGLGMSFNEESARYKTLDPVFYLPDRERPMMKVDGWKPGRPKFTHCDNNYVYCELIDNLKRSYIVSYDAYLANLALGIDPGIARDCLPVGIYSSCWVTCNPPTLTDGVPLAEDARTDRTSRELSPVGNRAGRASV